MKAVQSVEMSGTAPAKTQHFISEAMGGHVTIHTEIGYDVS